jgi:hypothetical protein
MIKKYRLVCSFFSQLKREYRIGMQTMILRLEIK